MNLSEGKFPDQLSNIVHLNISEIILVFEKGSSSENIVQFIESKNILQNYRNVCVKLMNYRRKVRHISSWQINRLRVLLM